MTLWTGAFATWLLTDARFAVSFVLAVLAAIAYVWLRPSPGLRKAAVWLGIAGIAAYVLLAAYASLGQYVAWSEDELGKLFLPPHRGWGYYAGYVLHRFWLAPVLGAVLAAAWYGFLAAVGKHSDRYLDIGELELTTLLVLAAGWPNALVLVPLAGVFLVLVSLSRLLILKRSLTTIGLPFVLAGLVTAWYGDAIRSLFGS